MTLLEVRCCCDPQKLLGYLPKQEGAFGRFSVPEPAPRVIELPIEEFGETVDFGGTRGRHFASRLAYKAEDVTIETLRQIPEFMEAR